MKGEPGGRFSVCVRRGLDGSGGGRSSLFWRGGCGGRWDGWQAAFLNKITVDGCEFGVVSCRESQCGHSRRPAAIWIGLVGELLAMPLEAGFEVGLVEVHDQVDGAPASDLPDRSNGRGSALSAVFEVENNIARPMIIMDLCWMGLFMNHQGTKTQRSRKNLVKVARPLLSIAPEGR